MSAPVVPADSPPDLTQTQIWCQANPYRGSVLINGALVPDGTYTIARSDDGGRSWQTIRNGTGTITTGGFQTEDSEPPFGVDLLYRVTIDQASNGMVIQRNYVTTPRVAHGIGSWQVPSPRTSSIVADPEMGENVLTVGPDPAGYDGDPKLTNLATNPTPGSATGWTSPDGTKWAIGYAAGEVSVNRLDPADQGVLARMRSVGGIDNPVLPTDSSYQRQMDVWADKATTLVSGSDPGGWVGGVALPANTWTTVREQFSGSGLAQYPMSFQVNAPTTVRTNRLPNPRAIQSGAGNWTTLRGWGAGGGNGNYSWVTGIGTPPVGNVTTCNRKTWTAASTTGEGWFIAADSATLFSIVAGTTYTVSAYVRHTSGGDKVARMKLGWYNGTAWGTAGLVTWTESTDYTIASGLTWTRITMTAAAPAGSLGLMICPDWTTGAWAVGNTADCTAVLFEQVGSVGSYFDGDIADVSQLAYDWAGAANASMSTATTDVGTGVHVKVRKAQLVELVPGAHYPVEYFDGGTTDTALATYDWTGAANASTSTRTSMPKQRNRIATVALGNLAAGSYYITGRIRYHDVNLMRWLELRDGPPPRTWQQVKNIGSWQQVLGIASQDSRAYGEVRVRLLDNAGNTVSGPVVVISPSIDRNGQWVEFNAMIGLSAPLNGGKLALSHGMLAREYTADWRLTRFAVFPADQAVEPFLHFFDGDWPVPADAEDYGWENGIFDSTTGGTIAWEGTAGNSTSIFRAPDVVYATVTTRIDAPSNAPCDPVHLNLPIQPSLGQWFGLIKISQLSHPGRSSSFEIIRRSPSVVVSDVRGWERGEMTLFTRTLEERRMAVSLFRTGQIVQLRNPDRSMPEGTEGGPWYLAVTDLVEDRPLKDHRRPERYWIATFIRVEKPVGLIDATLQTGTSWQQIRDANVDWQQVHDSYRNWAYVLYRDAQVIDPALPYVGAGSGLPTQQAYDAWGQEVLPAP